MDHGYFPLAFGWLATHGYSIPMVILASSGCFWWRLVSGQLIRIKQMSPSTLHQNKMIFHPLVAIASILITTTEARGSSLEGDRTQGPIENHHHIRELEKTSTLWATLDWSFTQNSYSIKDEDDNLKYEINQVRHHSRN
jgi:hypothetical protein